jgi:putative DNA primase/helicase
MRPNVLPLPALGAWLEQRGGAGAQEVHAGIEQVRAFIQKHGESRFQPWDSSRDEKIINRAGYVRSWADGRQYLIFPAIFKNEVCSGSDSKLIARELMRQDLLEPGDETHPTQVVRLPGVSRPSRMYAIKDTILGEGGSND